MHPSALPWSKCTLMHPSALSSSNCSLIHASALLCISVHCHPSLSTPMIQVHSHTSQCTLLHPSALNDLSSLSYISVHSHTSQCTLMHPSALSCGSAQGCMRVHFHHGRVHSTAILQHIQLPFYSTFNCHSTPRRGGSTPQCILEWPPLQLSWKTCVFTTMSGIMTNVAKTVQCRQKCCKLSKPCLPNHRLYDPNKDREKTTSMLSSYFSSHLGMRTIWLAKWKLLKCIVWALRTFTD